MNKTTIGIIDYGMGNHASVQHSLRKLGFRAHISSEPDYLDSTDVLILPGVGAYPVAMAQLVQLGLCDYLKERASNGMPIIGICLGMQLLCSSSLEHSYTKGLDIIPGDFVPSVKAKWHIGWNSIECIKTESLFKIFNGQSFYFNHSFFYQGDDEYQICLTDNEQKFASIVQKDNVVGLQFHPEKSQLAGESLLRELIGHLTHA